MVSVGKTAPGEGDDVKTLQITVQLDGAAFEDNPDELRDALARTADRVERGTTAGAIMDVNGNTAGYFEVTA